MSVAIETREIQMVPVDKIEVLNPRERNKHTFEEIVGNIKAIGLKKPITVTRRSAAHGEERYLLVCGEGRLKAYCALGEKTIPALVVEVSDENAFIMSLTENIARRQYRPLELLMGIQQLDAQGYDKRVIADKTGLTLEYVRGILHLLTKGEERLLIAIEQGRIPLNAALAIVGVGDDETAVQAALQEAYESGKLRGKQLLQARRVIERRRTLGRSAARAAQRKREDVTPSSLVRTYQREVDRQRQIVKKAKLAEQRLMFVIGALRELLADENFFTLLRAEGLDSLPKYIADRVWSRNRNL